jgi:hypothetical protein
MSGEPPGHIVVDDFLDFEHPADASASEVYERLRAHARMREIITVFRSTSRPLSAPVAGKVPTLRASRFATGAWLSLALCR